MRELRDIPKQVLFPTPRKDMLLDNLSRGIVEQELLVRPQGERNSGSIQ